MYRVQAIAILMSALLAGCSGGGSGTAGSSGIAEQADALPTPDLTAYTATATATEYRVGSLDTLEVSVFQVPELSKTVQVSANGEVALPLIGAVQAGGKTVAELEADIAAKLGATYLQSPQVSVLVKEATSQRVTVDGAVEKPGIVPLTGPTTLLQTIAMSGGLQKGADPQGIVVFRTSAGKKTAAKFDLAAIRNGTAEDPMLYGGDIVVVDSSAMRTALGNVKETLPVFSIFMPFI